MDELAGQLLELVPEWGAPALALITFLSCLAVPIPASLAMMAGGAFASAGDLDLLSVAFGALLGAIVGDQTGYFLGRHGGELLARQQSWVKAHQPHAPHRNKHRKPHRHGMARDRLITRAQGLLAQHGAIGIFLSRWLLSPLGPWMNITAGALAYSWHGFTFWSALGEMVWVALYVGLGMVFVESFPIVAELLGDASLALFAFALALAAGWWLWRHGREKSDEKRADQAGAGEG